NTHEVVLKKNLSGLGFSFYISQLRSGADRGSLVRIKRLFPGQPAQQSGLLQEGDVILSVNREPVKDLSYQVEPPHLKYSYSYSFHGVHFFSNSCIAIQL
ncbi:hypothetical protein XENOCAPTIV_022664, partial [Xenoophorus captivus]